jgi:hypothetical protein
MNHYLNFTLIGEDGRFHVLLPWQNAHTVGFNAIDAHLQRVVSEEVFDRTRQLKISEHQPEAYSRDFHVWQRQQTLQSLGEYEQQLHTLIGGVVQRVGMSQEGLTYLIITTPNTQQVFYVLAEAKLAPNPVGYLSITERQVASTDKYPNDALSAA